MKRSPRRSAPRRSTDPAAAAIRALRKAIATPRTPALVGVGFDPGVASRDGEALWRAFLSRERMAGRYPLRRKNGRIVDARYVAIANILPGLHVSALATAALVKRFGRVNR